MKRYILMPTIMQQLKHCLTDMFHQLFRAIEHLGFEIGYADSLAGLPTNTDVVIIFGGVHGKQMIYDAARLPRHTKVVLYLQAIHGFKRSAANEEAMQRFSFVLSAAHEMFAREWPEYMEKFVLFPNFFAPHERYARLPHPDKPIMKCLVTGHTTNNKIYPVRHAVRHALCEDLQLALNVDVMLHPRWWQNSWVPHPWEIPPALNSDYARELNKYFCGLATPSCYGYALAKYFEVPAAGSLLLGVNVPDVATVGLEAGKHFVEVTAKNIFIQIAKCLGHPEKYEAMRAEATEHVRAHHSVRNRAAQLEAIINEL